MPNPTEEDWEWATVTRIAPLRVTLDQSYEELPVTPESLDGSLEMGDRVWTQRRGRQLLIAGRSNGGGDSIRSTFFRNTQQVLRGGGVRLHTATGVSWSARFMVVSAGRGPSSAGAGYFDVAMPSAGTVIPVLGAPGPTSVTVTTEIPLAAWRALWYRLPDPGASWPMDPSRFFITDYQSSFDVPSNAVMICAQTNDPGNSRYLWGDGQQGDDWKALSLGNGWVSYGSGYFAANYQKVNGRVYLRGLIRNGTTTAGTVIANLPVGYRPLWRGLYTTMGGVNTLARVDVSPNGNITTEYVQNNGSLSLDVINFEAAS